MVVGVALSLLVSVPNLSASGAIQASLLRDCKGGFSSRRCDSPVVRGGEFFVLYPSSRVYSYSYPGFSNESIIVDKQLNERQRESLSGNISRSLSETIDGLDFESLPTGHYSLLLSLYEISADFFVPPASELQGIKEEIDLLMSEVTDASKLRLSLAFLFYREQFYSNTISLLWDHQEDWPDLAAPNLMLAASLAEVVPESLARDQLVRDLAVRVLLSDGATKEQRKEAIGLLVSE